MRLILLLLIIVILLGGGGWGYHSGYLAGNGGYAFGGIGTIVIILILLAVFGVI